jgi:endo-alpha-1,4-polygalactosaminidase (GH114 family)
LEFRDVIGAFMKYLFNEDEPSGSNDEKERKEDRYESIKMSIRRIKHNLDIIHRELEELERTALNDKDLIEVRERNYDEFVKKSINRKRPTKDEKDDTSDEIEDMVQPYRPSDFAKKLEEYDG